MGREKKQLDGVVLTLKNLESELSDNLELYEMSKEDGDEANTKAICEAVGFRYAYDEQTKQYAHAAAIMVVTPQGKVSRYFYGLEYSTRDLEFGLMEASNERIGSLADGAVLEWDGGKGK